MARAKPPVVRRGAEKSPLLSNQRIATRHSRRPGVAGQVAREALRLLLSLLHMLLGALVTLAMLTAGVARKVPGWVMRASAATLAVSVVAGRTVYRTVVEWCTFSPQSATDPHARREPRMADDFSAADERENDDALHVAEDDWEETSRPVRHAQPETTSRPVRHAQPETSLADLDSWNDEPGPWNMAIEQRLSRADTWDKNVSPRDSDLSEAFESAKMASLDDEEKSLPEEQLQDQAAALRALARGERWRS